MHRRSLDILGIAREEHGELMAYTATPLLSDDDRRKIQPVLRTFAVQVGALSRSRWWWGYDTLRLATGLVVVVIPIVVLKVGIGVSPVLGAALVGYLLFGGVALLGHGVRQRNVQMRVFAAVAVLVAVGTAVVAAFTARTSFAWLWDGAVFGLAAAAALLALAETRLIGLITIRTRVFLPRARRRAGWPLPPQLAAIRLLQLLDALHRSRPACRHPRHRADLLRWMDGLINYVWWELPATASDQRLGAAIVADAQVRANQLAGRLQRLHVGLAHDRKLDEHDRISSETAVLTMALVQGDWSCVTPEDAVAVVGKRAIRILKRLVPPVVLLASAMGLPYLPGRTTSSGWTGIQVGLALAAVLSLLPIETTDRERVMSAYANAAKRD